MAARQDWKQATGQSRRLALAADAELRRRHPGRKIEPLRSAEPGVDTPTAGSGRPPTFHRHADCCHPILPTWDYQLGKSVTLPASYLLNL